MIFLASLAETDGRPFYDMLQGIDGDDNGFHNPVKDMPYEAFPRWLAANAGYAHGVGLEDWMVPQTSFWLCDDGAPVGCGRIRHCLNDALRQSGGHIGYAIARPHRGKGYGNEILRLLLVECRSMGILDVHLTANKDNLRSNRIIMANGGVLARETEPKNHYIISLK